VADPIEVIGEDGSTTALQTHRRILKADQPEATASDE